MYKKIGKRIFDILFSLIVIILLSPIFLILFFMIKIDSKGPAIYKQHRVGLQQEEFKIYKFRTMVNDADKLGPKSTIKGDTRITKVGHFLRKYSLDELPQFFNVLFGSMSIVGPRPTVREFVKNFDDERLVIFQVKPGITGYAQIGGRSSLNVEEKKELEINYVQNCTFRNDLKVIIQTILNVIFAKGSF